jgi:ATP-dependent Clp protease protease subunit
MRVCTEEFEGENDKTLEDYGIFMFSGEVEEEICADAVRWIFEKNLEGKHDLLTVVVNSPGGCVTSGFSVIDAINGSKIPVRTIGMGILASMGLLIFITGRERILTKNTLIMSHQWSSGIYGKEHELVAGIKHNELISSMIMKHYKKHTGLTQKQISKHLLPPSDVYLSAEEAKKLGICDEIRDL